MRFRFINKILVVMGVSTVLFSCQDFLDINNNPSVASTADPVQLMVTEMVGMSNNRTSEIWIPVGISAQVFASGGNTGWGTDEDQYNISIFSTGNTWRELYTNVIKNAALSIEAAASSSPPNNNAIAQHKIMQAYAFWELTSLFGDIPFTEAVKPDITEPKFDSQAVVLQGIIDLLDEAVGLIDPASPLKIGRQDLYFNGDINRWKKFANSLKLRVLMMMVDSDPSKASAIAGLINANSGLASKADNVVFKYFNQAGNYNPMFNLFYTYNGGVNNWLFAINHTASLLKINNDPRLSKFFDKGPEAGIGEYNSLAPKQDADVDNDAVIGSFFLQPNSVDPLLTYSEHLLLQAEAHARGFVGSMQDADTKLRAGIRANMEFYGISESSITAFLGNIPVLTTLTQEQAIKLIAEQQWLDLYNRSLEAWTQWRRTEIPVLTPPDGALVPNMIRRWQYPPREVAANTKTPAQLDLDAKMWFDK